MNEDEKENRPVGLEILAERLKVIEGKLENLITLTALLTEKHTTTMAPTPYPPLLVGHAEIARFIRKSPSAVRRYARNMAFPAMRFGRHVVSHPDMVFRWLWAVETQRRRQRGEVD